MNQPQLASYEEKVEFLLAVLGTEEKQRQRIENKSTVLIASNTILVSAIIWLGLTLTATPNPIQWLQYAFAVVALGSAILSVTFTVRAVTRITPKQRIKILDLTPDAKSERNLFFWGKIESRKQNDYQRDIELLTEQEILCQLTSEVHNVSRLLRYRYRIMDIAATAFTIGMFAFAVLAVTKLFTH